MTTDHEQIRQLAAHYAVAVDSRDLDTLVGLFVDDVRVGRDTFGRDALRLVHALRQKTERQPQIGRAHV